MFSFINSRLGFLLVFAGVTAVLVGSSYWVIGFVYTQTQEEEEIVIDEALSAIYVDYYNSADQYVSADSYLAMGDYQAQFPEPQNVQVLVGESTSDIIGYMLNLFSAGMGVDCTYCHSLANFAADEWEDEEAMANKVMARTHLLMSADLNQNWLTQLPDLTDDKQPYGSQIVCATCHNGHPAPRTWPGDDDVVVGEPLRLPLDDVLSVEEQGILNVNGRNDIGLETTQYNQAVMYHMNETLGVGCTHCHNSRYFPDYSVPAKFYSMNMLQMSAHLQDNWSDALGGQEPSCHLCHRGVPIPSGAARNVDVVPAAISSNPDQ